MLRVLHTISHGSHHMPCPQQAVQERPNRVNFQAIAHQGPKTLSKCVVLHARKGSPDVDVWNQRLPCLSACRTNAPSARKSSRPNTTGSVTKSRSIYHSRDGFARFRALVLPRSRSESSVVSFAVRFGLITPILKRITTRHVRREVYRSARFTAKITLSSTSA